MPKTEINLTLLRDYKPEATLGHFIDPKTGHAVCASLERPKSFNKENHRRNDPKTPINESCCIPEGAYQVIWSYSPSFKKETFQILDVPGGWEGLRIHSANWINELLGCIAPATVILNMNPKNDPSHPKEKKWQASQSRDATQKLADFVGKAKKFTLTITSKDTLCKA